MCTFFHCSRSPALSSRLHISIQEIKQNKRRDALTSISNLCQEIAASIRVKDAEQRKVMQKNYYDTDFILNRKNAMRTRHALLYAHIWCAPNMFQTYSQGYFPAFYR